MPLIRGAGRLLRSALRRAQRGRDTSCQAHYLGFVGVPVPSELSERWRQWVTKTLGGSDAQIERATDAVMTAVAKGLKQSEVVKAATEAWRQPQPLTPGTLNTGSILRSQGVGGQGGKALPLGYVRGRVGGFNVRSELHGKRYVTIWNFYVQGDNASSGVGIQMRGYQFSGAVVNGEIVSFRTQKPDRDGIVHLQALRNETANTNVRVTRKYDPTGRLLFGIAFLLAALAVVYSSVPARSLPPRFPGRSAGD